ncbi:uncharacterized protein [Physcomitrium patens]|uniref:uncharacterized protein isoform X2 n=1 Tax=Physcomitrium patens TaxID=3218 RepID=UPI003CCCE65A
MAACICNGIQAFSVEFLPALGLTDWTKGGLRLLSLLAVSATPSLDQECLDAGDWDDLAAPGFRRLIGSDMLVIYCSKEVLSVCLSAVVAGLEEVAGWIGEVNALPSLGHCQEDLFSLFGTSAHAADFTHSSSSKGIE